VFAKELLGESERAPSHEALAENANISKKTSAPRSSIDGLLSLQVHSF
jgi:hypothetical protein